MLALIVVIPLVVSVLAMPGWFLRGHRQVSVVLVAAALTFDGIMVAATALFTPQQNYLGRSILVVSVEFIVSAAAFLLSFRGFGAATVGFVHAGTTITIGLTFMFGRLVSLLVLLIGSYLTDLLEPKVAPLSKETSHLKPG